MVCPGCHQPKPEWNKPLGQLIGVKCKDCGWQGSTGKPSNFIPTFTLTEKDLPTWEEIKRKVSDSGDLTRLEGFIYANEPAQGDDIFRDMLADALTEMINEQLKKKLEEILSK